MGGTTDLEIGVDVTNLGEDSFESFVIVTLPAGVSYVNVDKVGLGVSGVFLLLSCIVLVLLRLLLTVIVSPATGRQREM